MPQVLIWAVSSSRLELVAEVGCTPAPGPDVPPPPPPSPVRGMLLFPQQGMLLAGYDNGCLAVSSLPQPCMSSIVAPRKDGRPPVWMIRQVGSGGHVSTILNE